MARRRKGSKKHSRKRSRGMGGLPKDLLVNVASLAAGSLGATMVGNVNIPFITDPRIKQGVPLLAGIALIYFGSKNPMLTFLGYGMAAVGGSNLLKGFVPGLSAICGEGYLQNNPAYEEYARLNGEPAPAADNSFLQGVDTEQSYNRG